MSIFENFHRMYLFLYPIYFSKSFLLKLREGISLLDKFEQIWNFERKLKMVLNLCYLLHLFRILAITCCSKFQLIRDWCFLKGNLTLYNFYRNREIQISTFFWPKMRFKLLLKIMTFFELLFFFFFEFFMDHISKFF